MQQDRIALRWSVCCIIFCVIEHVALSLACVHRLLLSTHGNHPLRMLGSHLSASYDKHGRSIGCWSGDHHNVLHVESPVVTSSLFVDSQTYHRTIWLDIPSAYSQRQRKPSIANCCCSGKVCDTGSIYTRLLPASNYLAQSLKVMFVLYRIQVGCGVGGGRELSCRLKDHHRLCMEESKQRNCGPLSLSSQRARPTESVYEKESVCYYDRHRQSIFNATPLINSSPMNPQKTEGYFFLTNRRSIADESCERRSNLLSLPATTVYSSRPPTNPFERLSRAWLGWSSRERRKEESTKNENHYAETVDGTDQHWRQQEEQQRHHGNISIGVEQPDQQLQTQNQQQQQPQKQQQHQQQVFDQMCWRALRDEERGTTPKLQVQVWLTIYNLIMDQECRNRYDMTHFRRENLLKLRRFLNESLCDELPFLKDLHRLLEELALQGHCPGVSGGPPPPIVVEMVAEIGDNIKEKYDGRWEEIANKQISNNFKQAAGDLRGLAELITNVNLHLQDTVCAVCGAEATQRCSQCKHEWYCSRACQVKHWQSHKELCVLLRETKKNVIDCSNNKEGIVTSS
eukprot:GHVQ01042383.1.p1 GENE.GHVQ01042383.1~~GHVQ01042383.1.p1  ORF type:complete len:569 (+),score=95.94 GHVQ01042383.1:241-1947(+)